VAVHQVERPALRVELPVAQPPVAEADVVVQAAAVDAEEEEELRPYRRVPLFVGQMGNRISPVTTWRRLRPTSIRDVAV